MLGIRREIPRYPLQVWLTYLFKPESPVIAVLLLRINFHQRFIIQFYQALACFVVNLSNWLDNPPRNPYRR